MELNVNMAAICGLFCGTCPSYLHQCDECLSDGVLMEDCQSCSKCGQTIYWYNKDTHKC